jgi:integrase
MAKPANEITKAGVEARLEEIALGRYTNPLWRELQTGKKSGDPEKLAAVVAACEEIGVGIPQKEKCGTPKQAEKFARYLRMVLVAGKEPVFESGDDPVTAADPVVTILEVAGEDALDIEREALPMRKDEVAAAFNYTRQECRQTKNGLSQDFDPFVWQSILACRLALLTGYRMKDIATLHDGNDKGDRLTKKKGECAKRPKVTHTLPVSNEMRDIIDEARAMRDGDAEVLRKRFKWTKSDLLILSGVLDNAMHIGRARDAVRKRREAPTVIFPSLTNWSEQKQASQIARPAFNRMKALGHFRPRDRRTGPGEWLGEETLAKPHDMRSTFATYAFGSGVDLLIVSRFMNHAISKEQQAMTAKYIGATSDTSDKFAELMQQVSDSILDIAKQARKEKLTVIK